MYSVITVTSRGEHMIASNLSYPRVVNHVREMSESIRNVEWIVIHTDDNVTNVTRLSRDEAKALQ